ncbi:MAG: T9SS type A sorting domain-containing protein [Ignavibacteriae bacterium]|nr:T9SS type A sorting domain-containing protein [Ignavibacteriota bacterium]
MGFVVSSSSTTKIYSSAGQNVVGLFLQANNKVESGFLTDTLFRPQISEPQQTIELISPNGSETWDVGASQNVSWTSSNITTVRLEYSTNNGTNWDLITNSTLASSGTYPWTVPNTPSTQCKVRVSDSADGTPNDVSDNIFTIRASCGNSVSFTIPTNLQGAPGTIIQIPVNINPNIYSVGSFDVTVCYNSSILTYRDSTRGPIVPNDWTINTNPTVGCVNIGAVDLNGATDPLTGSGTAIYLNFTVSPDAPANTNIPLELSNLAVTDIDAIPLPTCGTNGEMTVVPYVKVSGHLRYYSNNNPLGGDTINLSGVNPEYSDIRISNGTGYFEFDEAQIGGTDTLTPRKIYDCPGGVITAGDALLAFKGRTGGPVTLTPYQKIAAEVNGDCQITSGDALAILKRAIGLCGYFRKFGVDDWRFVDSSFVLTSTNWCTTPKSRYYSPLDKDTMNQSFLGILLGDVNGSYTPTTLALQDGMNLKTNNMAVSIATSPVSFVVPSELQGCMGDIIQVPLTIDPSGNAVGSFDATVCYDTTILSYQSLTRGPIVPSDWTINDNSFNGCINIGAVDLSGNTDSLTGSGTALNLTFIVKTNAQSNSVSPLTLSNLAATDIDAIPLTVGGQNGQFTVTCPVETFIVLVDSILIPSNIDTMVPVRIELPQNVSISSAEIRFGGFQGSLEFLGIDTVGTLFGSAGWTFFANSTPSLLITASAGSEDIVSSGILFHLKFHIPLNVSDCIPVTIDSVVFNTGENPVSVTNGEVCIEPEVINLVLPNGGEGMLVRSIYNIQWTSENIDTVRLEYTTNNGTTWNFIADTLAILGTYAWTVPDSPSTQCKVKISDASDGDPSDESDGTFTIYTEQVHLFSPNGGKVWIVDSTYNITWTSQNIANVKLEYSTVNGGSWKPIVGSTPAGSGAYPWVIPDDTSSTCLVRVSDASDGLPNDVSDNTFTIFKRKFGDVDRNGRVQAYDAALVLKYKANKIPLDTLQKLNADASNDSEITACDAAVILQYVAEIISSLPHVCIAGSGNISMTGATVPTRQSVEVPFYGNNCNNIISIEGVASYNRNHLTFSGINWSEGVGGFIKEVTNENGKIYFVAAGAQPIEQDGLIGTLVFDVKDKINRTTITLDKFRWNEETPMENVASVEINVLGVDRLGENVPEQFMLHQNYPNPFNPVTTIKFSVPASSDVNIVVTDVLGREVVTLVSEHFSSGTYQVTWDVPQSGIVSGLYLYKMIATPSDGSTSYVETRKMIVLQ